MSEEQKSLEARVPQSEVPGLYDRLAGLYDVWGHLAESRARKRSLALANVEDGQHVLEVAVGTGLAFQDVVKRNGSGRNVGIDISGGMLAKAEKRLHKAGLANFELAVGSAFNIQEGEAAFDVLLNSYMFDLLDESDWPKALKEFQRVLKPEGRLIVVNMTFGERPGSGVYDRLYRLSPRLMGGCRGVGLSEVLQQAGFNVHLREYVQQLLFPSEVILASKRGRWIVDGG
jgi:ubiquinone/menaquinone biosynthesis C-methylase UbiE